MIGHLNSSHFIVVFAGTSAILANLCLILLIAKHSRPEFGRYKYLMLVFATNNIFSPIFNLILMPGLHVVGYSFIFYVASPLGAYISASTGQWMMLYWCVLYDQQLILIVFHFLYRYIAICQVHLIPWFRKTYVQIGLLIYAFTDLSTWTWFMETQCFWLRENRWYIKEDFLKYYGMEIEGAALFGTILTYNDTNGHERYRPYSVLAASMNFSVLLYKFVIMVWFTIQIHHTLKYAQMSAKTKRLQMDLLHALIAQTACPFVMEGTPCLTVHVLAFFSIHISDWCSFFFIPVDLYPLMDALTMIYFIRDYRRVVINNLKKMKLDLSQGTQPKNTGTVENLTGSTNVKTVRTTQTHEATDRTEKDGPSNSSNFI